MDGKGEQCITAAMDGRTLKIVAEAHSILTCREACQEWVCRVKIVILWACNLYNVCFKDLLYTSSLI